VPAWRWAWSALAPCTTRRGCRILREAMGDVLTQVVTGDSIEI